MFLTKHQYNGVNYTRLILYNYTTLFLLSYRCYIKYKVNDRIIATYNTLNNAGLNIVIVFTYNTVLLYPNTHLPSEIKPETVIQHKAYLF